MAKWKFEIFWNYNCVPIFKHIYAMIRNSGAKIVTSLRWDILSAFDVSNYEWSFIFKIKWFKLTI